MDKYAGTWGQVMWYGGDHIYIHPEEFEKRTENQLYKIFDNRIMYCLGIDTDGYLTLKDIDDTYRAKPDNYVIRPKPKFLYGDFVQDRQDSDRKGIVWFLGWHFKHKRIFCHLQFGNRKSTRRYFDNELMLLKQSELFPPEARLT